MVTLVQSNSEQVCPDSLVDICNNRKNTNFFYVNPHCEGTILHIEFPNQFSMCLIVQEHSSSQASTLSVFVFLSLAESHKVYVFLTNELVRLRVFKHQCFNLFTLARCHSCKASIRDIIQMVEKNFPYCSEEETLKRVIQLMCQETALEVIRIRRCTVLAYELICSLLDDAQNPYHHKLGAQLMQRGEL